MALGDKARPAESNLPLADYFWIAGVDSKQLLDAYKPVRWSYEGHESLNVGADNAAEDTIPEDVAAEQEAAATPPMSPAGFAVKSHRRKDSYQRLSELSDEARYTISALENANHVRSNRSSTTIKPVAPMEQQPSNMLSDVDFEEAMKKFTTDRESFFLDMNFNSNNTAKPSIRKPRTKTQKIVPEELSAIPNRTLGSVRRHLSFKDMTSSRRNTMARHGTTKTARRISTYNSVITKPEVLQADPSQHPLKRKFEPVLLDKFPRSDMAQELSRRSPFPDYLPMFAFPNDINIISSDARPRSTWHEFSMTAGDNSKIPAVCLIVHVSISRHTADELENRCEEWRRNNVSDAERDFAASLAQRLALERAKLSRLLSQLPQASPESAAREELEEEISAVEEKIALMSDALKPLRHGAASKIEGLTDGDTGLWIPRAYGILGRDPSMLTFWRQWLRAVAVPMHEGSILRVPASSPKIGMWQPLERYVNILCAEAPSPISSKIQVDLAIRELHLYAKKEAANELPGSRTTDLYPLCRALTIPNLLVLLEYVLSEAKIIFLSSHLSMLQLASKAILELIWPFKWAGVCIPILPYRLIQALDAPCPYICGIHRSYERYDLPEDDFVLVDLDKNELRSTAHPPSMPKQIRRKLMSLLHLAAPHHHSFGVSPGPPAYAIEAYPFDAFPADHPSVFTGISQSTNLAKLVSLSSSMFGPQAASDSIRRAPILNAFVAGGPTRGKSIDRPRTASTARQPSKPDSDDQSPIAGTFPQLPTTPTSHNDSGYALQTSLREKRSGHFDTHSKRNVSLSGLPPSTNPVNRRRKASLPFAGIKHSSSPSTTSLSPSDLPLPSASTYTPSVYAQSTLAASTIMPGLVVQPAHNTATTQWVEGHCLQYRARDGPSTCVLCNERAEESYFRCTGCGFVIHGQCASQITVVCPAAFYPDQVRAAFARCFASLLYMYKKFLLPSSAEQRKAGMQYAFDLNSFTRSLPAEHAVYLQMLSQTQAFNEFIAEREQALSTVDEETKMRIALFDNIVMAKKQRTGRFGMRPGGMGKGVSVPNLAALSRHSFMRGSAGGTPQATTTDVLNDVSTHQWRPIAAPGSSDKPDLGAAAKGRDYREITSRTPAKLEDGLFKADKHKTDKKRSVVPSLPRLSLNGHVAGQMVGGAPAPRQSNNISSGPGTNARQATGGALQGPRKMATPDKATPENVRGGPPTPRTPRTPLEARRLREGMNGLRMNSPD